MNNPYICEECVTIPITTWCVYCRILEGKVLFFLHMAKYTLVKWYIKFGTVGGVKKTRQFVEQKELCVVTRIITHLFIPLQRTWRAENHRGPRDLPSIHQKPFIYHIPYPTQIVPMMGYIMGCACFKGSISSFFAFGIL